MVVGQGAADLITDDLLTEHEKSPKVYQRDYRKRFYKFFDYNWRKPLPYLSGAAAQLDGRPSSAIGIS